VGSMRTVDFVDAESWDRATTLMYTSTIMLRPLIPAQRHSHVVRPGQDWPQLTLTQHVCSTVTTAAVLPHSTPQLHSSCGTVAAECKHAHTLPHKCNVTLHLTSPMPCTACEGNMPWHACMHACNIYCPRCACHTFSACRHIAFSLLYKPHIRSA
jgi:hypothetical protein